MPLPSQPKLVLIYRPRRDERLSWLRVAGQLHTETRNTFRGTWYLSHSQLATSTINERTVPIIMAGCMAYARDGRISTSGLKSDVTVVFLNPISFKTRKFRRFGHKSALILRIFYCACAKLPYFHFRSKIWRHHRVSRPRFPLRRENFGNSAINERYIVYFSLRMRETAVFPLPV